MAKLWEAARQSGEGVQWGRAWREPLHDVCWDSQEGGVPADCRDIPHITQKEGFPDVATRLRAIGRVEAHHEARYDALDLVRSGSVFKKQAKVRWACMKCGYVREASTPPVKCPSCDHDKGYFMLLSEQY